MIKELYDKICRGEEIRSSLIEIKKLIKEDKNKRAFAYAAAGDFSVLTALLSHEDPKVRKNVALVLGEMESDDLVDPLFAAYEKEDKLFVKSSYLKAAYQYPCEKYLASVKKRIQSLSAGEVLENEKKHIQEEQGCLQKILLKYEKPKSHKFTGYGQNVEVILLTNPLHGKITEEQIEQSHIKAMAGGLHVKTGHLENILPIRTWKEILFVLDRKQIAMDPVKAAKDLAESNLYALLQSLHEGGTAFYFRVDLRSRMERDKQSSFIKKFAAELEAGTGRKLINNPSGYEVEIRLIESKKGGFLPLLKLYTIKDERFIYRREYVAASIAPVNAALLVALGREYMKEEAQILDPFCGVGTMLLERNHQVKAGTMYGTDTFGEAIEKGRVNAEQDETIINFINRDFLQFEHDYLFDEIISNMPVQSKTRSRQDLDSLYQGFFGKAAAMVKEDGYMFLYTNEMGLIKKNVRLFSHYRLVKEILVDKKNDFYLFVIKVV